MVIDKNLLYINKDNVSSDNESSNLFEYSLNALLESNNDIIKRLNEEAFVMEVWGAKPVKVFNFFGILDAIIGAFINLIQKLIGRFLSLLVTLAGQGYAFNIEARAFADKIKNFRGTFVLRDVWKFTNLEAGKFPGVDLTNHFSDSLNKYIEEFNDAVDSSKTAGAAVEKLNYSNINIREDVNVFRHRILAKSDSNIISDEIFAQECFKVFRDNREIPYDRMNFNGSIVYSVYYTPYMENHKLQAQTKKDSKRIQDSCKAAKNKLKKFTPNISKYSEEEYSDILNAYNNVQRSICQLFDQECRDVVTLYGAKLQAYKDSYAQSKRVIMKCMQEIAKNAPFANKE
jgi:hypothetical protein